MIGQIWSGNVSGWKARMAEPNQTKKACEIVRKYVDEYSKTFEPTSSSG